VLRSAAVGMKTPHSRRIAVFTSVLVVAVARALGDEDVTIATEVSLPVDAI
jgi:hypothetical protein